MNSVLHGTWIVEASASPDEQFFVWAERAARAPQTQGRAPRVRRHPYAATAIEIADLLARHVPERDWRTAERLTRVALLPSTERSPVVPPWLVGGEETFPGEETPQIVPWRVEGLGIPILEMLDVLAALPLADAEDQTMHRVGADLHFWSLAAKFALELLAGQRFLPGLRATDDTVRAIWLPLLDDSRDRARFEALAKSMPPACRAVFRERPDMASVEAPVAWTVLQSFLEHLMDRAVREWAQLPVPARARDVRFTGARRTDITEAWWHALAAEESQVVLPATREQELTDFYRAWQSWSVQGWPAEEVSFRLCFRLEPPDLEAAPSGPNASQWTLRYFLQDTDDPSLLLPAQDVWRERGDVLSYLNRRFDQPQEKLLAGLGLAARLCPAIQRSLRSECPEAATLTSREAYTFLRETARLLEGLGFGVMVPPWWNRPDARLTMRATLHAPSDSAGSGLLGMDSLIAYDWELALGDEALTQEEFERLARLKAPLVQVRGRWVLLQPDQIEAAIAFWEKQRTRGQIPLHEALRLALAKEPEISGLPVHEIHADEWLTELLNDLARTDRLETVPPPQGFVGQLRPYQVRGLSWLAFLRRWGFGACLADDMGLGKTIQAIVLLLHERGLNPEIGPALVICPTSLVGNWRREVERFAPSLRVMVHHGSGRAEGEDFVQQSTTSDLVISTYGLARRDVVDLTQVRWSHIILDEAQNIKNPLTQQARAIRKLVGDHRAALTGTPIENRLSELWSIMSFLNPGYLGSLDQFRRAFAIPIERYQDDEAAERLRALVRPFILRRLKTDPQVIRDLPDKFEYKVYCNLTREQATLYEAVVRDGLDQLQSLQGQKPSMRRRGMVLAMLTRLKQVCNHPAHFLGDGSEISTRSGKMNRLCEMLEEVLAVGDRALVFTQFAQMGHLLQRHLQEVFGREVLFLYGGTPQVQRDRMITRFQEDPYAPSIFVLSLKAGGTGLNLERANHVFHYDRWWNPAVEDQATDRAHRIGQTRDVQAHKFICVGTLEERIDELIESKRSLAEMVVGAGESWLTELSSEELRDLIALRAEAVEGA